MKKNNNPLAIFIRSKNIFLQVQEYATGALIKICLYRGNLCSTFHFFRRL